MGGVFYILITGRSILRPQLGMTSAKRLARTVQVSKKTAYCLFNLNFSTTPHFLGEKTHNSTRGKKSHNSSTFICWIYSTTLNQGEKNTYTIIWIKRSTWMKHRHFLVFYCFKSAFLDHGKLVVLTCFTASNHIKSPFWFCEITKFWFAPPLDLQDRSPRVESGCCC